MIQHEDWALADRQLRSEAVTRYCDRNSMTTVTNWKSARCCLIWILDLILRRKSTVSLGFELNIESIKQNPKCFRRKPAWSLQCKIPPPALNDRISLCFKKKSAVKAIKVAGGQKKKKTFVKMDAGQRRERAYEPVWRWASSSCGDKAAHGEPCENAKQAIWWSGAEGGREACVWERQPRSICQQTVTKGAWRGLFLARRYSQTICKSPAAEAGPKAWRTAGALAGDWSARASENFISMWMKTKARQDSASV